MKTIRKIVAAITVVAVQWCVTAATIEVETVVELTNAVARANAGEKIDGEAIDTIVLKTGTYTFPADVYMADNTRSPSSASYCKIRLNVTVPGLTIKGEDNSSRTTWTNGSEPVIIDGNGGKGMQLQLNANESARIENITFVNCNGGADSSDSAYGNWCNGGAIGIGRMVSGDWSGGHNVVVSNCVFRGNQSYLGGAIGAKNNYFVYDCFFTNNVSTDASGAGCMFNGTAYGCEMVGNMNSVAKNVSMIGCNVHGNGSTNRPLLTGPATYSNCTFRSNTTSSTYPIIACYDADVRIVNCEFSGNSNDSTTPLIRFSNSSATKTNDCLLAGCTFSGNAASALTMFNGTNPLNGSLTVTNCSFIGNTANATAATGEMPVTTVSVLVRGIVGDKNRCMIYDSVSSNNQSKVVSGTMGLCNVLGVHAVRCTFTGDGEKPYSSYTTGNWRYYNEAADNSILEECDVSNGEMRDCVVDRCRIHNVTSNVYAVFKDSAFVTNTLVECCGSTSVASYLYSSIYRHDAEFVNCTIVSNNCFTFSLNASAGSSVSCIIDDCRFVNCLFNANRADFITTVSDFTIEDKDACLDCFVDHVEFAHSAYGIFTPHSKFKAVDFAAKTNGVDTLTLCANPKFADEPKWSLSLRSPLVGKGDASIWTDEDIDLAGKLRLRDGKADIGCYQCWLNPAGFMLIVR